MNPKKFHLPITVACLFIGILAYNMWVPNEEWYRNHPYLDASNKATYQLFGWLVGGFFFGMSYLGLYGLVCAFLERDETC